MKLDVVALGPDGEELYIWKDAQVANGHQCGDTFEGRFVLTGQFDGEIARMVIRFGSVDITSSPVGDWQGNWVKTTKDNMTTIEWPVEVR